MPRADLKHCHECGRHVSECGPLSHNRLCGKCGMDLLAENIVGLIEHKGEPLRRWRLGMIRAAGGIEPANLRSD